MQLFRTADYRVVQWIHMCSISKWWNPPAAQYIVFFAQYFAEQIVLFFLQSCTSNCFAGKLLSSSVQYLFGVVRKWEHRKGTNWDFHSDHITAGHNSRSNSVLDDQSNSASAHNWHKGRSQDLVWRAAGWVGRLWHAGCLYLHGMMRMHPSMVKMMMMSWGDIAVGGWWEL